jgi:hypothetical protein
MTPEELVSLIGQIHKTEKVFSLGVLPSNYSSGKPQIIFDGEETASLKAYPYLSSYTPSAGDRVLIANIAGSHVILGKVMT